MRDYSDYKTPNVGTLKDEWEDVTKGFRDIGSAIKGGFDKIKSIPQRREQKIQKQMEQGQKRFDEYIAERPFSKRYAMRNENKSRTGALRDKYQDRIKHLNRYNPLDRRINTKGNWEAKANKVAKPRIPTQTKLLNKNREQLLGK